MEALRIYRIEDRYIRFLKRVEPKVQDNKNRRRPYVGVVLYVGRFKYFVPMESPKPNHRRIKGGKHIFKIDDGRLGLLGFNNMIPVTDEALICVDIDKEPDEQYAGLLRRQAAVCNRSKPDILDRASRTYYDVVNGKNKFLCSISCDFKALERECHRYNPNHRAKKNTGNA